MLTSKWLDILKDHDVDINALDDKTVKTIEYTTQTVNMMSTRIEDMKMQIDHSFNNNFNKSNSRHVSFQNINDLYDKPNKNSFTDFKKNDFKKNDDVQFENNIRGGKCGFAKTKS